MIGAAAERDVGWIEPNQLDRVGRSVAGPLVDVVIAVANGINISVAAVASGEIVVAALAVEGVGTRTAIEVFGCGRAAKPRRRLNLASVPRRAVGKSNLFDAVGAAEVVCDEKVLSRRIDLNEEM